MQLGASLPVGDIGTGPAVIRDYAQTLEGLGFDYIQAPDGSKPAVPVMGTFVVGEHGKITRWTDYFDVSLTVKLLQGEDISALIPANA